VIRKTICPQTLSSGRICTNLIYGYWIAIADIITSDNFCRCVKGVDFICVGGVENYISYWQSQSPLLVCWRYRAASEIEETDTWCWCWWRRPHRAASSGSVERPAHRWNVCVETGRSAVQAWSDVEPRPAATEPPPGSWQPLSDTRLGLGHSLTNQDRCPTRRTAARQIPEGTTIFCSFTV